MTFIEIPPFAILLQILHVKSFFFFFFLDQIDMISFVNILSQNSGSHNVL